MKGEYAIFRFDADLAVEHVHAFYRKHRFPPHSHADYLIGLTTEGTEDFVQAGQPGRSVAGSLRTINPGVVHEGGSLPEPQRHGRGHRVQVRGSPDPVGSE